MFISNSSREGFTLLELLVVIGMLAILMTVFVVAVNPLENIRKASDVLVINDISALSRGAEAYATSHNGYYPATLADLKASDEVRIEDAPPVGYALYTYQSFPVGCSSGISCTSIVITGQVKGSKYSATPFVKFESQVGKVCFVANSSTSCN